MNSSDIFEYEKWLHSVQSFVEHAVLLATQYPDDPTYKKNTDDLIVNGYSLKGQEIEISRATGNVFIKPDLFTFAHWLKQKEKIGA